MSGAIPRFPDHATATAAGARISGNTLEQRLPGIPRNQEVVSPSIPAVTPIGATHEDKRHPHRCLGMKARPRWTVAGVLAFIAIVLVVSLTASRPSVGSVPGALLAERRAGVVEAFNHGWAGYSKYCFGHDTLRPVTNTCEDDFGGWGVTAVDALTTAIMMEQDDVVVTILKFISSLDFRVLRQGGKIQTFEIAIRTFAAMLSAWDLLHGPYSHLAKDPFLRHTLYDQMVTMGNVLSCAFGTPSGIPRDWVDPLACETDDGTRNTVAGAGTMILEFARLSDITKNSSYRTLAETAEGYLLSPEPRDLVPYPGLVGSYVSVLTGRLSDDQGSWGAFADSFYEYLIKAYVYDSGKYISWLKTWLLAADSTIRHIASHPFGHPEWVLLPSWSGNSSKTYRMESLSWFAGGNFILGGMVVRNSSLIDFGLSLADTAGALYNMSRTGLGGEFASWKPTCEGTDGDEECDPSKALYISDPRFRLRPEVLETWYYAYRATQDRKYLDWSWNAFVAINRTCRTDSGFTGIEDVNKLDGGGVNDVQESFVYAEVMKYVFLAHLEDWKSPVHVQDSRRGAKNRWVFNTEAHPLLVSGPHV